MAGKRDDIDLMQFHDGELSAEDATEVRAQLEASEKDRDKVTALGQVGDSVRTYLEVATDEAEPALAGMWDRIERRIHANGEAAEADEGIEGAAGLSAEPARPARAEGGALAAIRRWLDAYRGNLVTGAVTAGAVAALFLLLQPTRERVVEKTVHVPAPVEVMPAALGAPATVEYLDVIDGSGTVLTIPGEDDGDATTVLWIEPDEDTVEGPI